jgi:TPP-dependent 2-oxoacid decarboxylase
MLEQAFHDVAAWNWQLALQFMGATPATSASYRVTTEAELLEVLASDSFQAMDKIQLVELVTDKMDSPPNLIECLDFVRGSSLVLFCAQREQVTGRKR